MRDLFSLVNDNHVENYCKESLVFICFNSSVKNQLTKPNCTRAWVASKDSDQPAVPPIMVRILVYPSLYSPEAVEGCDQGRLRSDFAQVLL